MAQYFCSCTLVLEVDFSHSDIVMHLELILILLPQTEGRNTRLNENINFPYTHFSDDQWF